MAYSTINKSTDYFNTVTYTGNGSYGKSVTGVGFQPDFIWIKNRSTTHSHRLSDAVRGTDKALSSDNNSAELSSVNLVHSFDSDGFTVDDDGAMNGNGNSIASWNWKANGAGSSNTDGTINSTVSVNATAGFSIVKWTGNNTGGATVGHGLGAVPKMIIFRNYSITEDWTVYHHKLSSNNYKLDLNNTSAEANVTNPYMENTTPTNSLITLGDHQRVNGSGNSIIAYCFAEKTGYSKFGSYTGNGNADGTFVYTGFKPAFVIVKPSNYADNWHIIDNKRDTYNTMDSHLFANLNNAEVTSSSYNFDMLSNGFKPRSNNTAFNGSYNYIYMAFGQSLVGSNNVPCTAR